MTKCNFAGDEKAGASWTDKIMANKADTGDSQKSEGGQGAEEDEWVRSKATSDKISSWIRNVHLIQKNLAHIFLLIFGNLSHNFLNISCKLHEHFQTADTSKF